MNRDNHKQLIRMRAFLSGIFFIAALFFHSGVHAVDFSRGISPSTDGDAELNLPKVTRDEMMKAPELEQIRGLKGKKGPAISEEMQNLRLKAVREVAERIGFQEGYIWRYRQIDRLLKSRELALDSIFDFGPFLLEDGKVVPPVIASADAFMEIKSPDEMVSTGKTYKILKPAKFVTVKPSWRDYLVVPEGAVKTEKIHPSTLPQNGKEREAWIEAVDEQWLNGIEYADKMFQTGVNKLLVDLRGLIQYKVLADRGYISMPRIAKGHLAINVGSEQLEFDQQTFRITEKASFKKKKDSVPGKRKARR